MINESLFENIEIARLQQILLITFDDLTSLFNDTVYQC